MRYACKFGRHTGVLVESGLGQAAAAPWARRGIWPRGNATKSTYSRHCARLPDCPGASAWCTIQTTPPIWKNSSPPSLERLPACDTESHAWLSGLVQGPVTEAQQEMPIP